MPLPSATINPINLQSQVGEDALTDASTRYAIGNMASLGQNIANSISINNMRSEARALAPQLAQSYQQGLSAISNGDIAGGMQHIYQTSAAASTNPLLQNMAKQVQTGAGILARGAIGSIHQGNAYQMRSDLQQNQFAQQDQLAQQKAQAPTPATVISGINTFNKTANDTLKALKGTPDANGNLTPPTDADKAGLLQNVYHVQSVLNNAGMDANNPYIDAKTKQQIGDWNNQIQQLQQQGPQKAGGFLGFGSAVTPATQKAYQDQISNYQNLINTVTDAATKAAKEGRMPSIAQPQAVTPPMQQGMQDPTAAAAVNSSPQASGGGIPSQAVQMLKSNPSLANFFDQKYGQGAAQSVLGQ